MRPCRRSASAATVARKNGKYSPKIKGLKNGSQRSEYGLRAVRLSSSSAMTARPPTAADLPIAMGPSAPLPPIITPYAPGPGIATPPPRGTKPQAHPYRAQHERHGEDAGNRTN